MSNFKPNSSRKRNYKPDNSSNCDSSSSKRNVKSSETWNTFLSNLLVDLEGSKINANTELVSTENKLLKANKYSQTESLSYEKYKKNSVNNSSSSTDNKILNNEDQNISLDIECKNAVNSLSPILSKNNEEGLPSKSWSEFLVNISQNVIKETSPKICSENTIKIENYQNFKTEKDTNNLFPITSLRFEKHMKTESSSDIFTKTSQKLDNSYNKTDCNSNKINESLCFKIKNEIDIVDLNYLIENNKTSTPVKKLRIKKNLESFSDISCSSVCLSDRSLRQKSILERKEIPLQIFRGEIPMRIHMKTVHLNDTFPWKCSDCGEKFSVFIDFVSHEKVVHNKHEKTWNCYICAEMGDQAYQCHYCEYSNASLLHFKRHLNKHKVDKSIIQCHFCDKQFDKRNVMMDHVKSFHREEKLECQICGIKSTNLSQHISLVHSGPPKTCSICGQQFKYKRDLQHHEKKKHNAKPLTKCDICGMNLPDYYYQKRHMLAHDKHLDENGQYLPIPESEMRKLDEIIKKRRNNNPNLFVSTLSGPDQPNYCSHFETDVARQQANVLINSKMTDTSDLTFFMTQNNK